MADEDKVTAASPLSGGYLLIVLGEPNSEQHKQVLLQRLAKGLSSWDSVNTQIDIESELKNIAAQCPNGEDVRNGEKLIQLASDSLVTEILIHPQVSTLKQCLRNLLASFTRHRHIVHAGYTLSGTGAWILQDGLFEFTDMVDMFQEPEVQRLYKAYESSITMDLHCAEEGPWSADSLRQEPAVKSFKVAINPAERLGESAALAAFSQYISDTLPSVSLEHLLEPTDVVGNIRFNHPTLYVFPGGQGDSALFGISGFNILVDGGFGRKPCFWDFARHLDRLDAVVMTRNTPSTLSGLSSVVCRKAASPIYPQVGHVFCNLPELADDADGAASDPLIVHLPDMCRSMTGALGTLQLKAQPLYRSNHAEPINLYHKVGHGTLDMYVISPSADSAEVKELARLWRSGAGAAASAFKTVKMGGKEFRLPLLDLVSVCALLVWQPADPSEPVTRLLFPGSAPQHKILEGLEKLRHLDFLRAPVCTAKNMIQSAAPPSSQQKSPVKSKSTTSPRHSAPASAPEPPALKAPVRKEKPKEANNKETDNAAKSTARPAKAKTEAGKTGSVELRPKKADAKAPVTKPVKKDAVIGNGEPKTPPVQKIKKDAANLKMAESRVHSALKPAPKRIEEPKVKKTDDNKEAAPKPPRAQSLAREKRSASSVRAPEDDKKAKLVKKIVPKEGPVAEAVGSPAKAAKPLAKAKAAAPKAAPVTKDVKKEKPKATPAAKPPTKSAPSKPSKEPATKDPAAKAVKRPVKKPVVIATSTAAAVAAVAAVVAETTGEEQPVVEETFTATEIAPAAASAPAEAQEAADDAARNADDVLASIEDQIVPEANECQVDEPAAAEEEVVAAEDAEETAAVEDVEEVTATEDAEEVAATEDEEVAATEDADEVPATEDGDETVEQEEAETVTEEQADDEEAEKAETEEAVAADEADVSAEDAAEPDEEEVADQDAENEVEPETSEAEEVAAEAADVADAVDEEADEGEAIEKAETEEVEEADEPEIEADEAHPQQSEPSQSADDDAETGDAPEAETDEATRTEDAAESAEPEAEQSEEPVEREMAAQDASADEVCRDEGASDAATHQIHEDAANERNEDADRVVEQDEASNIAESAVEEAADSIHEEEQNAEPEAADEAQPQSIDEVPSESKSLSDEKSRTPTEVQSDENCANEAAEPEARTGAEFGAQSIDEEEPRDAPEEAVGGGESPVASDGKASTGESDGDAARIESPCVELKDEVDDRDVELDRSIGCIVETERPHYEGTADKADSSIGQEASPTEHAGSETEEEIRKEEASVSFAKPPSPQPSDSADEGVVEEQFVALKVVRKVPCLPEPEETEAVPEASAVLPPVAPEPVKPPKTTAAAQPAAQEPQDNGDEVVEVFHKETRKAREFAVPITPTDEETASLVAALQLEEEEKAGKEEKKDEEKHVAHEADEKDSSKEKDAKSAHPADEVDACRAETHPVAKFEETITSKPDVKDVKEDDKKDEAKKSDQSDQQEEKHGDDKHVDAVTPSEPENQKPASSREDLASPRDSRLSTGSANTQQSDVECDEEVVEEVFQSKVTGHVESEKTVKYSESSSLDDALEKYGQPETDESAVGDSLKSELDEVIETVTSKIEETFEAAKKLLDRKSDDEIPARDDIRDSNNDRVQDVQAFELETEMPEVKSSTGHADQDTEEHAAAHDDEVLETEQEIEEEVVAVKFAKEESNVTDKIDSAELSNSPIATKTSHGDDICVSDVVEQLENRDDDTCVEHEDIQAESVSTEAASDNAQENACDRDPSTSDAHQELTQEDLSLPTEETEQSASPVTSLRDEQTQPKEPETCSDKETTHELPADSSKADQCENKESKLEIVDHHEQINIETTIVKSDELDISLKVKEIVEEIKDNVQELTEEKIDKMSRDAHSPLATPESSEVNVKSENPEADTKKQELSDDDECEEVHEPECIKKIVHDLYDKDLHEPEKVMAVESTKENTADGDQVKKEEVVDQAQKEVVEEAKETEKSQEPKKQEPVEQLKKEEVHEEQQNKESVVVLKEETAHEELEHLEDAVDAKREDPKKSDASEELKAEGRKEEHNKEEVREMPGEHEPATANKDEDLKEGPKAQEVKETVNEEPKEEKINKADLKSQDLREEPIKAESNREPKEEVAEELKMQKVAVELAADLIEKDSNVAEIEKPKKPEVQEESKKQEVVLEIKSHETEEAIKENEATADLTRQEVREEPKSPNVREDLQKLEVALELKSQEVHEEPERSNVQEEAGKEETTVGLESQEEPKEQDVAVGDKSGKVCEEVTEQAVIVELKNAETQKEDVKLETTAEIKSQEVHEEAKEEAVVLESQSEEVREVPEKQVAVEERKSPEEPNQHVEKGDVHYISKDVEATAESLKDELESTPKKQEVSEEPTKENVHEKSAKQEAKEESKKQETHDEPTKEVVLDEPEQGEIQEATEEFKKQEVTLELTSEPVNKAQEISRECESLKSVEKVDKIEVCEKTEDKETIQDHKVAEAEKPQTSANDMNTSKSPVLEEPKKEVVEDLPKSPKPVDEIIKKSEVFETLQSAVPVDAPKSHEQVEEVKTPRSEQIAHSADQLEEQREEEPVHHLDSPPKSPAYFSVETDKSVDEAVAQHEQEVDRSAKTSAPSEQESAEPTSVGSVQKADEPTVREEPRQKSVGDAVHEPEIVSTYAIETESHPSEKEQSITAKTPDQPASPLTKELHSSNVVDETSLGESIESLDNKQSIYIDQPQCATSKDSPITDVPLTEPVTQAETDNSYEEEADVEPSMPMQSAEETYFKAEVKASESTKEKETDKERVTAQQIVETSAISQETKSEKQISITPEKHAEAKADEKPKDASPIESQKEDSDSRTAIAVAPKESEEAAAKASDELLVKEEAGSEVASQPIMQSSPPSSPVQNFVDESLAKPESGYIDEIGVEIITDLPAPVQHDDKEPPPTVVTCTIYSPPATIDAPSSPSQKSIDESSTKTKSENIEEIGLEIRTDLPVSAQQDDRLPSPAMVSCAIFGPPTTIDPPSSPSLKSVDESLTETTSENIDEIGLEIRTDLPVSTQQDDKLPSPAMVSCAIFGPPATIDPSSSPSQKSVEESLTETTSKIIDEIGLEIGTELPVSAQQDDKLPSPTIVKCAIFGPPATIDPPSSPSQKSVEESLTETTSENIEETRVEIKTGPLEPAQHDDKLPSPTIVKCALFGPPVTASSPIDGPDDSIANVFPAVSAHTEVGSLQEIEVEVGGSACEERIPSPITMETLEKVSKQSSPLDSHVEPVILAKEITKDLFTDPLRLSTAAVVANVDLNPSSSAVESFVSLVKSQVEEAVEAAKEFTQAVVKTVSQAPEHHDNELEEKIESREAVVAVMEEKAVVSPLQCDPLANLPVLEVASVDIKEKSPCDVPRDVLKDMKEQLKVETLDVAHSSAGSSASATPKSPLSPNVPPASATAAPPPPALFEDDTRRACSQSSNDAAALKGTEEAVLQMPDFRVGQEVEAASLSSKLSTIASSEAEADLSQPFSIGSNVSSATYEKLMASDRHLPEESAFSSGPTSWDERAAIQTAASYRGAFESDASATSSLASHTIEDSNPVRQLDQPSIEYEKTEPLAVKIPQKDSAVAPVCPAPVSPATASPAAVSPVPSSPFSTDRSASHGDFDASKDSLSSIQTSGSSDYHREIKIDDSASSARSDYSASSLDQPHQEERSVTPRSDISSASESTMRPIIQPATEQTSEVKAAKVEIADPKVAPHNLWIKEKEAASPNPFSDQFPDDDAEHSEPLVLDVHRGTSELYYQQHIQQQLHSDIESDSQSSIPAAEFTDEYYAQHAMYMEATRPVGQPYDPEAESYSYESDDHDPRHEAKFGDSYDEVDQYHREEERAVVRGLGDHQNGNSYDYYESTEAHSPAHHETESYEDLNRNGHSPVRDTTLPATPSAVATESAVLTTRTDTTSVTTTSQAAAAPVSPQGQQQTQDKVEATLASWGKPLGLPAPVAPVVISSNGNGLVDTKKTPTANGSPIKRAATTNGNKASDKGTNGNSNPAVAPFYVDLAYIPHHCDPQYADVDFFRRVRARHYVLSSLEPSAAVLDALLEGKQSWTGDDKELDVTIIPTYDSDALASWVSANEDLLARNRIDLAPSASRCTINLQDHETSCSAYRLEF